MRHKVGAFALIALGVFFLTPEKDDQPQQSSNPWATQSAESVQVAAVDDTSFVDDLVSEAGDYLDEAGINPVAAADETVGRFDNTASAYSSANR